MIILAKKALNVTLLPMFTMSVSFLKITPVLSQ